MSEIPENITGGEAEAFEQEHDRDVEMPLPPATFEFLVLSLKMQAEMAMGLLNYGAPEDRPKPDLRVARHSIDMLAMMSEKTRGNLSYDEERLLQNTLTELRFRFVQATESKPQ